MTSFPITIDGQHTEASPGQTILSVARSLGIDIPSLCYLEKCGPLNSCLACVVKVNGKLVPSCGTKVQPGMVIESETEEVHTARRTALELLFSDHVGDCLSPCHRLCPLSLNIPVMLRHIQAGKLEEARLTVREALPLAGVLGRLCHHPCEQGCRRGTWDDPAAIRDLERFVTDWEFARSNPESASPPALGNSTPPSRHVSAKPASGKAVAIIGAGPVGLSAAHYLVRSGHAVTVVDRNELPGGTLRLVPSELLPPAILAAEVALLAQAGVEFKLGVELGHDLTIDGLTRGFEAILLTLGEFSPADVGNLGLPTTEYGLKADPNTCETPLRKVFAAGAAAKPLKQLVRAVAEGRAAAECIHRFLSGRPVRRPEKPFSSVMGRLDIGELRQFLATSHPGASVSACDRCSGFNAKEAATEAHRCLHCDCRSSGNCLLQHYAQVYGAEANRFRGERRKFEQQVQSGGVIFEPGKCILCGICVKLTELAREPLGLTFIGRGFEVRLGVPLNHTIQQGLQKVARECVAQCPTGALEWSSTGDFMETQADGHSISESH
jgi:NADPH-dependent glutamate synthase beta subunit-like oxidoreductase